MLLARATSCAIGIRPAVRRHDAARLLEVRPPPGDEAALVLCDGDVIAYVERLCAAENIRLVLQDGSIVKQLGPGDAAGPER